MFGYSVETALDAPKGRIYGMDVYGGLGMQKVGLEGMNRLPKHW
mgnify:CR=1 FL=1